VIDLSSDDPLSDKGKEKGDIEMVDATNRPGTSVVPGDDTMEESARWPNFIELTLVWVVEELPR
jgi:hypothetical protein